MRLSFLSSEFRYCILKYEFCAQSVRQSHTEFLKYEWAVCMRNRIFCKLEATQNRLICTRYIVNRPVSSGVKSIVIDSGGLEFNSRTGQIGHGVANGSPPLQRLYGAVLPIRAKLQRWTPRLVTRFNAITQVLCTFDFLI